MSDYRTFELEEKFMDADNMIKDNYIAEAVRLLNEILEEAPDFGKAHNHLGWIYETKTKDYTKAIEHYRLALKFTPDYAAAYYNYAIVLSTLRQYEELEKLLNDALKVKGINFATIYNEFAIMNEAQGKYDEAIKNYKLYIQNSYDNKMIETAADSIKRCERKKELL
jgi:tetratricopeptide (TPR) repeat protein